MNKPDSVTNNKSIVVIGGGISGLYAAWQLSELGYRITLLEKQQFLGGFATSLSENNCNIDIGPHYVSVEKKSKIYDKIFQLIDQNDIIELHSIENSYKSYFRGKILGTPPRLYHGITVGRLSILQSFTNFFLRKFSKNNKFSDSENYLISLFGNYLFNSWCKPLLIQNFGSIPPLDFIKKSFEPLTINKFLKFFKNQKQSQSKPLSKKNSNLFDFYFKNGMGSFIDNLQQKIIKNNGEIVLGADIKSITHTQTKSIFYEIDKKSFTKNFDIILYSIPLNVAVNWFEKLSNSIQKPDVSTSFHSIMVFLLIDTKKLFDGWILNIVDLSVPFFRISQQTFLSSHIAPKNQTVLCVEIRSNDTDPLWLSDEQKLFSKIISDLTKIKLLNDENVTLLKILKFKNLYPSHFSKNSFDKNKIENYINSHVNEYALGTAELDTGRLVSNDDITKEKQNYSLGGFFGALLNGEQLVNRILTNKNN